METVEIRLTPGGKFEYKDSQGKGNQRRIRVTRGETINWICANYNWALEFLGGTPLNVGKRKLSGGPDQIGVKEDVDDDAPIRRYEYLVAVWDHAANGGNGVIYTDDPEVDVED